MSAITEHRKEVVTILALNLCNEVDACDTCYLLANKQFDNLIKHPDEIKTLKKHLKYFMKEEKPNGYC